MARYYGQNCHICRYVKALKNWYNSLLNPLPILLCLWTNIFLDFVTGLFISNGFNAILIIIDCLTQKRHCIPCIRDKNNTTIKAITQLLLQNMWKIYSFPLSLTLDRSSQFILGV